MSATILVQMMVSGRPVWRITRDVSQELARRMRDDQLASLGDGVISALAKAVTLKGTDQEGGSAKPDVAEVAPAKPKPQVKKKR